MQPGPDHPIAIAPAPRRLRVRWNGRVIADSSRALALKEASYPPVLYFPREDADMTVFSPSARKTHCPYKGEASYFTLTAGDTVAQDAVWSYATPLPAVSAIAGHLAFYPDRVTIEDA